MRFSQFCVYAVLTGSIANLPAVATASGTVGPLPLPETRFSTHAACTAHLDELYRKDNAKADPAPLPAGDHGETRQTLVYTKGVEVVDPGSTVYAVEIGYSNRIPRPDVNMIRTTYSYEKYDWSCKGGLLTGQQSGGYHSDGYMPIDPGLRN